MSGIGESVGAVIEGGLLARAVEPSRGEASGTPHAPTECLNCGAMVTGHYCGQCGQKGHVHRSLSAIGHDIMHGVLHLDGKLWNTLPLLAFKPGQLTRRFIQGERAKFVSPMAMFLFTVFAMFAVFQIVGISPAEDFAEGFANYEGAGASKSAFRTNIQQQVTTLEQRRDRLARNDPRRAEIDSELKGLAMVLEGKPLDAMQNGGIQFDATGIETLDKGIIKKWRENPSLIALQAAGEWL